MDHVNPNCIAGASSLSKVVSFIVPEQALYSVSVSLVYWDSHCTAELPGACTTKSNVHQRKSARLERFHGTGLARL